jgi:hypothetical protein
MSTLPQPNTNVPHQNFPLAFNAVSVNPTGVPKPCVNATDIRCGYKTCQTQCQLTHFCRYNTDRRKRYIKDVTFINFFDTYNCKADIQMLTASGPKECGKMATEKKTT